MASESIPGGRAVVLNLPCNPPSATSSVYAESEASADTVTSLPSFASNSTIGDFYYQDDPLLHQNTPSHAYVPRNASNTLPSNPLNNTPLPLLQLEEGDTLLFLSPPPSAISPELASRRAGPTSPPLRTISSRLLGCGSDVFKQLLESKMQQRIINRLIRQKKLFLTGGKLPKGIDFVLDLTPEDEGERAVEWQEKLWCPDLVLKWKSTLEELPPLPPAGSDEDIAKKLDEFREKQWGSKSSDGEGPSSPTLRYSSRKPVLPEPYSFGRHVLGLERLIHILHGIDPVIQSTVDWYTLHCLSVAFGTTDATRDYIARWIFSNTLIIETHPAFVWKVAVEAGLATIASDAFAAAVIKYCIDPADAEQIPGATEAGISLVTRAQKELKDILSTDWMDQYLPQNSSTEEKVVEEYYHFKTHLRGYVKRAMAGTGGLEIANLDDLDYSQATIRSFWLNLGRTNFCQEQVSKAPTGLNAASKSELNLAIYHWKKWDDACDGGDAETSDLWRDVKLGAPKFPVPSVTQHTNSENYPVPNEDAKSEVVSESGTEIYQSSVDDDVKSVSSTHTLNQAMRNLDTESLEKGGQGQEKKLAEDLIPPLIDSSSSSQPTMDVQSTQEYQTQTLGMFNFEQRDNAQNIFSTQNDNPRSRPFLQVQPERHGLDTSEPVYFPGPVFPLSSRQAPIWLTHQLSLLSTDHHPAHFWAIMHHPNSDHTKTPEPRIRCYDCPDMLYFAGPGQTLDNFRIHLRNVRHLNNLETRNRDSQVHNATTGFLEQRYHHNSQSQWSNPAPDSPLVPVDIPSYLATTLKLCETYLQTKCQEMSARNIVFDPILLEEQIACLEETERRYMPLWSGGEALPSNQGRSAGFKANRGVSDAAPSDEMTINMSTTGVGSVCTASSFATTESFSSLDIPTGSISSGSIVSFPTDNNDEDDIEMSNNGSDDEDDEDDWDMAEDDEDFDDAYFT